MEVDLEDHERKEDKIIDSKLETRQRDRRFNLELNLDRRYNYFIVSNTFWNILRYSGQKGAYSTRR